MRILVVTPTFLPAVGGAELVVLQVYRRLAARHSVVVLTRRLPQKLIETRASNEYDALINFGVRYYEDSLSFMRIPGHRISQGLIPPFSLSAVRAVKLACEALRPDVVNVHYVMPTGLSGLYAQKALRVPVVVTFNGRDVPGPGVPRLWKYWHRWVGRNCADVTFVSKYCREVIFGRESKLGHIVHNGVDPPEEVDAGRVRLLRSHLGIPEGSRVLFSLQRLDYQKRVDIIIQGLPRVLEKYPNAYLIIGGKGEDEDRLRGCVEKLGIHKRVVFSGYIPRGTLPVYHAMADVFLFHSTYETFGMVLMEAMSYGSPVVSVRNTAVPDVVQDGQTGVLVPTEDANAFAEAVIGLLKNDQRRLEMGRCARERALKSYSWDTIAPEYEAVLERVASL